MNFTIHTPRLMLRPLQPEDAPALHSIANQPHILKWMRDWALSPAKTKRLIEAMAAHYRAATKDDAWVLFAVLLQGALIGVVGIGNKKEVDNEIEIAYFISADHAGRGYITEAAKAAARWALDSLQLEYLIAIVEIDNDPSQRIVEKCGFQKLETRRILNAGETEEKPFYYYRLYRA